MNIFFLLLTPYRAAYGLTGLAHVLDKRGNKVQIAARAENIHKMIYESRSKQLLIDEITEFKPDIIGISTMTMESVYLENFIEFFKLHFPDIPLVVGGYHTLIWQGKLLEDNPGLDYVFYGEAEDCFPEFIEELQKSAPNFDKIKGLIYRKNGDIHIGAMPPTVDIDKIHYLKGIQFINERILRYQIPSPGEIEVPTAELRPPKRHEPIQSDPPAKPLDLASVKSEVAKHTPHIEAKTISESLTHLFPDIGAAGEEPSRLPHTDFSLTNPGLVLVRPTAFVLLTRGCPYDCKFCALDFENPFSRIRFISPEVFKEHLDYTVEETGARSLFLHDSSFNLNKKWAYEIMEIIRAKKEILEWGAYIRPNLVDEEFLKVMRESRCTWLNLYIEGGTNRIRNEVQNKKVTDEDIRKSFQLASKYGFNIKCNIIVGNPTETYPELIEGIDYFLDVKPSDASGGVARAMILPGTEWYTKYHDREEKGCWGRSHIPTEHFIDTDSLDRYVSSYSVRIRSRIRTKDQNILLVQQSSSNSFKALHDIFFSLHHASDPKRADYLSEPGAARIESNTTTKVYPYRYIDNIKILDEKRDKDRDCYRASDGFVIGNDVLEEMKRMKYETIIVSLDNQADAMLDVIELGYRLVSVKKIFWIVPRAPGVRMLEYDLRDKVFSESRFNENYATLLNLRIDDWNKKIASIRDETTKVFHDSYSWKIGSFITQSVKKYFGWLPFVRKRLEERNDVLPGKGAA